MKNYFLVEKNWFSLANVKTERLNYNLIYSNLITIIKPYFLLTIHLMNK